MNISFLTLILALSALALITIGLALPNIRSRIVGTSNLRNALIPIATAGVLGAIAFTADILKIRIQQDTVPEDNLTLYIQKVDFGVPQIPYDYRDHDYTTAELKHFLGPLMTIDEILQFTDEERSRLDQIASSSGMLNVLTPNQSINTKEIADLVSPVAAFYFNYTDWSKASLSWANLLDSGHKDKNEDKAALLKKLVDAINIQVTAPGLLQGIVGMAWRQSLSLQPVPGDCSASSLGLIHATESDQKLYLSFPTFRSVIASSDAEPERREIAQEMAKDFEFGCLGTLSQAFRGASTSFASEAAIMDKYVKELNRILADKQPESIRISVAISNIGQFNSFVRESAKVAVGPLGRGEKYPFVAHSVQTASSDSEDSAEEPESYIQVSGRSTKPVVFYAPLSPDLQRKIYGAYESEQSFLKLGVIASAGANEGTIYSQVAPFSSQTQEEYSRKVDQMKITF